MSSVEIAILPPPNARAIPDALNRELKRSLNRIGLTHSLQRVGNEVRVLLDDADPGEVRYVLRIVQMAGYVPGIVM